MHAAGRRPKVGAWQPRGTGAALRGGYTMSQSSPGPEPLIARARAGDSEALGRLLESYRNYLRMLSRSLIGQTLRLRLDSSDLIQETFLEAHRDFPKFAGTGEPELAAWLRR